MPKIGLKYVEESSQRTLTLNEGTLSPLGFGDLVAVIDKLDQPISFPFRLTNIRVERSEFDDLNVDVVNEISTTLNSSYGSTTIGLLNGGWLPSGLALSDSLLIPDRCTVAAIRSRFLGGTRKNCQRDDFLDFLAEHPVKINPMLYAMEGFTGGSDDPQAESELSSLFDRAAGKILAALPTATIFPPKPAVMCGTMGLLRAGAHSFAKKAGFLMEAASLLAPSIGRAARPRVFSELFRLAEEFGIRKTSIFMLTVLSAAAANQRLNPARDLLKPKVPCTEKNANNALSDLRALDMLIGACTDFPNQRVILLTDDKALALLWTGIRAHSFCRSGDSIHYQINPDRRLFAGMSVDEQKTMMTALHTGPELR